MKHLAIICFAVLMIGCSNQDRAGPTLSTNDSNFVASQATFVMKPYNHPRRVRHTNTHLNVPCWRPTDWLNWLAAGKRPNLD